jgi:glycosyltransferase involved in cell wall biosynthesis
MQIGFDAKRAFFNRSGLGNYSRHTISLLSQFIPEYDYVLYSPKPQQSIPFYSATNISIKGPGNAFHKYFSSYWRSFALAKQLVNDKIDLFHGLSNELPKNINKTGIPSVVTIHDLIFMRYPQFYNRIDRMIYAKKFKYAAQKASRIIAISIQTKNDLMKFFGIPDSKIDVVYQGCDTIFWNPVAEAERIGVLSKYGISGRYILNVGTIEERKNLLNLVRAIHKGKIDVQLVVIGKPTSYLGKVIAYIEQEKIQNIHILHNVPSEDLPAFYQQAELFVYLSLFEGFGIPVIESLVSKTPVITSKDGCFSEAGGSSSIYVDPYNIDEIADAISSVIDDPSLRDRMTNDGFAYAQFFRKDRIVNNIMEVYKQII